jgi:outer membrane protein OmpA-like peptidoglycan-associated protein
MRHLIGNTLIWVGLLFSISCAANQNFFVLLPDSDGRVGQVAVSNQGGTQVLSAARQAVSVKSKDDSPEKPFVMEEKQITALFGEALSAQPDPPLKFLLYFKKGTSDLTEESQKLIPEILNTVKTRKLTEITITGHTDRVGPRELNFKIAFDRAKVIKHLLIYQGIKPELIEIASHGEDNPLIKTDDEVPEPRNRRVEVTVR